MAGVKTRLQESILRKRGLRRVGKGRLAVAPLRDATSLKTWAMIAIENHHGKSIVELLSHGTVDEVSSELGIHRGTVSKWRHRLGLVDGR